MKTYKGFDKENTFYRLNENGEFIEAGEDE